MNRRGFLGTILALGTAPAVVRAESMMRLPARLGWTVDESGLLLRGAPILRIYNAAGLLLAAIEMPEPEPASNGAIELAACTPEKGVAVTLRNGRVGHAEYSRNGEVLLRPSLNFSPSNDVIAGNIISLTSLRVEAADVLATPRYSTSLRNRMLDGVFKI